MTFIIEESKVRRKNLEKLVDLLINIERRNNSPDIKCKIFKRRKVLHRD